MFFARGSLSPRSSTLVGKLLNGQRDLSNGSLYAKTIPNLGIDENSSVIYQGMTGRAATSNAQQSIAHGTRIVGRFSPGKGGSCHAGIPVFDTVSEAVRIVKPQASAVFVPGFAAGQAIEEAIEAKIPLMVSVAEHVPVHDMLRVQQMLRTQDRTRLVDPNCPGIIVPSKCHIFIMPHKQISKGSIGIVSKSGTLSYEAVGATTEAGLGQSLVIGEFSRSHQWGN